MERLLGIQRPRAETADYDIRDLEVVTERDDPEAKALRAEFYRLDDKATYLQDKQKKYEDAKRAYERETNEADPSPGILKHAQTYMAFHPGLTVAQKKELAALRRRMAEIEAIPGVLPKVGGRTRRRKPRKTNRRTRPRTQRHKNASRR